MAETVSSQGFLFQGDKETAEYSKAETLVNNDYLMRYMCDQ